MHAPHRPYPTPDHAAETARTGRQRLLFSLALLSLPLAFQFADAAIVPVPDSMRLVLTISVWATLVVLELACGAVAWVLWRALRQVRRTQGWRLHAR